MIGPMTEAWDTPEKMDAARDVVEGQIDGYRQPAAWALGITSATSDADVEFPHVNAGTGLLPAAVLARRVGHASGTQTHDVTTATLEAALDDLAPALACTSVQHPNTAAWKQLLAEATSNPERHLVVVYVDDLDDPVSSEADGALRLALEAR